MKILVFTEGTILMHLFAKNISREERVKQSKKFVIQKVKRLLGFNTKVIPGSIEDYSNYIPIGNAVEKITNWKQQGAEIFYLTSRRIKSEIDAIQKILQKDHFSDSQNLLFRKTGEDYKDVAERLMPDILIEDDCESIGGKREMTFPNINSKLKEQIKSLITPEFSGIDHLPDSITNL